MSKRKVIFRADGDSAIGLGHVVRCCALADMLREDFDCYFSIRNPSSSIQNDILKYCLNVEHLDDSISYPEEAEQWSKQLKVDEIIVLDGYHFDTIYQQSVKSKGCKLVCIDDIHAYHFVADIVINHAGGNEKKDYSVEDYTQLFIGPKYALLRMPFLEKAKCINKSPQGNDLMVCLGGADPGNQTLQILHLIPGYSNKINIVIGNAYRYMNELRNFLSTHNIQHHIYQNIDAEQMSAVMQQSSIAICSPSTVTFEYLSVVNGKLYLLVTADNQKNFYEFLLQKSIAFPFHDFMKGKNVSPDHTWQNKVFDGLQKERYLEIFKTLQ